MCKKCKMQRLKINVAESSLRDDDFFTFTFYIFVFVFCFVMLALVGNASADLIGYWKLDENNGTSTSDSSGYGNNGAIIGAIWTSGKSGPALYFDGIDDYVLCAERVGTGPGTYPPELMPDVLTVSCWTMLDNFAYFSSFVGNGIDTGDDECGFFLYNWGWEGENEQDFGLAIRTESGMHYIETPNIYQTNTWYHLTATYDGTNVTIYVDGSVSVGPANVGGPIRWISAASGNYPERFAIGVWLDPGYDLWINGIIDEVGYWNHAMTETEVKKLAGRTKASEPSPADGSMHPDTWVTLSWVSGAYADSHDVYLGESVDDVTNGTGDTFRGNETAVFYVAGFPGFAYPDGLVPGTTYYWRIDEVNEAHPDSPWKGDVWSFSIPPRTAYHPDPADGAEFVDPNTPTLSWTPGFRAKLHTVFFGDNYGDVDNATGGIPQGTLTYNPGQLELEKVYYWRVDEFDGTATYKGEVWSFTTPGAVGNPQPVYGATDVPLNLILSWTPADSAASHELYLGTDKEAVRNADSSAPEYKGSKSLGDESYDPGLLDAETTYYWRVDEVDGQGNVSTGPIWVFTTGGFLLVDDFEGYTDNDAEGEAIWQTWIDGFGVADNGAQVGYLLPSYAEQTIVYSGFQSMPLLYVNEASVTNSEASMTLTTPRDWTVAGVTELSLWFRGVSSNAAEPLYVAVSNTTGSPAVVAHGDSNAAQASAWTEWVIPLQAFADKGINLTNVDKIAIGLGAKSGVASSGGSGTMYVDDIRLD
jgi:hypothetical protein